MNARIQTGLRWFLALVALCVSNFAAFLLGLGLILRPESDLIAKLLTFGISPRATVEVVHRLSFLLMILTWIVPPACAIGFAMQRSQSKALRVALSVSLTFVAVVYFFWSRSDRDSFGEFSSAIAVMVGLTALILPFVQLRLLRSLTVANMIAALLLFGPSVVALSRKPSGAAQPRELWSTSVQQDQSPSMNTGSEYAATRHIAFAGDRIIVVSDTGLATLSESKDKWPSSTYRLISLDRKTGEKRNEITFPGRWGGMPYIHSTRVGSIYMESNPPQTLSPDLTPATDAAGAVFVDRAAPQEGHGCGGSCDFLTYALSENTSVRLQQKHFQVLDKAEHVLSRGNLVDWGVFAGSSSDGRRFAIQSSSSVGDPSYLVYEYFTIYDVTTGSAIATVHMKDLPDRQSWTAFSPDGRFFAAGKPSKLTMYELP